MDRARGAPGPEKNRPELRYVRARVALSRGDAARALPLLDGLEATLPLLAESVQRHRAEAEVAVGPFSEGGAWFAARSAPSSQLEAARAFEKARDVRRARAAADRVVLAESRTRDEEAEARALRARLADAATEPTDSERADARWLATQGADQRAAADAIALVSRMDPKRPLTATDWMLRAHVLSDAGRVDDAVRAIELSGVAPGADKVKNVDREHARGMALYRARAATGARPRRSSAECAGVGGAHAAEDAFYSSARPVPGRSRRGGDPRLRRSEAQVPEDDLGRAGRLPRSLSPDAPRRVARVRSRLLGVPAGVPLRSGRPGRRPRQRALQAARRRRQGFARRVRGARRGQADQRAHGRHGGARRAAGRPNPRRRALDRRCAHPSAVMAGARGAGAPSLRERARPSPIDPPEPAFGPEPPPLVAALPPPSDLLHQLGLEADAEATRSTIESTVIIGAGARAPEALCGDYGVLDRARRRFQFAQSLLGLLRAGAERSYAMGLGVRLPFTVRAGGSRRGGGREAPPRAALGRDAAGEAADPDVVSPARAVGLIIPSRDRARIADELAPAALRRRQADEPRIPSGSRRTCYGSCSISSTGTSPSPLRRTTAAPTPSSGGPRGHPDATRHVRRADPVPGDATTSRHGEPRPVLVSRRRRRPWRPERRSRAAPVTARPQVSRRPR